MQLTWPPLQDSDGRCMTTRVESADHRDGAEKGNWAEGLKLPVSLCRCPDEFSCLKLSLDMIWPAPLRYSR